MTTPWDHLKGRALHWPNTSPRNPPSCLFMDYDQSLISFTPIVFAGDTEVHIKVYAPRGFVRNSSEVYFNVDKPGDVITKHNTYDLKILQYGNIIFSQCIL